MADALDVISLAAAKEAINKDASLSTDDGVVEAHITAVSRRLDELIGPIVEREVTEHHDGGRQFIRPRQTPVSSITTIREAIGTTITTLTAESFGATPSDAYLLSTDGSYAHRCRILRRNGGRTRHFACGAGNIEITYTAGRAADTDAVDVRISDTAGMILRRLWRRESGSWAQSPDWVQSSDTTIGIGFFKVVDSVAAEFLADEMKVWGMA